MDDAVAIYRDATEANDLERLTTAIAPDAELLSPLSGRMAFEGADDLRILLGAVYSTLRDLRWVEEIGVGSSWVMIGECRIGRCG